MPPSTGVGIAVAGIALAPVGAALLIVAARHRSAALRPAYRWFALGGALCALCALVTLAVLLAVVAHPDLATMEVLPPPEAGRAGAAGAHATLATVLAFGLSAGVLGLCAGLLRLPGVHGGFGAVLRHVLDALVIAAAAWFVGWVTIAATPPERVPWLPPGGLAVLLPAAAACVAAGLAVTAVLRCPRPRGVVAVLGAGVTLSAVAGWGLPTTLVVGRPLLGLGAALALPAGLLTVWAAGRWAARRTPEGPVDVLRSGTAFAFVPMLAMSVAAIAHWVVGGDSYDQHAIGAGIVEGFSLAARQYLALFDARRAAARLREREAHYRELAHTDPLTGLANRRGLLRALREPLGDRTDCVVLGMDLDGFKNINDLRGHEAGDQVLVEVAHRLRENLRPGDVAARLGGDEFAVLMWTGPADAERVAQRLLGVLCQPYRYDGATLFLSASIGLAAYSAGRDVPGLLRDADLALRYAKQRGKSRVERYDAAYDELLRRRMTLEHELRGAVERGELHLAYQPVVALPSVRPVGAEALLRWHHPALGQVPPAEFIPLAEESQLINRLGAWALHQACHQLSRWLADGHDVWVSVNVSPRELHSAEYVGQVAQALEAHRVPPQRLVLEVTEHAVATDLDELVSRLRALRMTGVRIALDDFGAGYSSLGQLRNLPVDILKIDQSLVAEPQSSRTGTAAPLVDVVVRLGHRLGLEVIAEGIAEPGQRGVVEAAGCRWGQGWLFGAPVPAEHLEARLATIGRGVPPLPGPRSSEWTRSVQHVRSVDSWREMRQA
ncbi:MAG TPA: bifunctional diguanylate cyclase/phosphodiesterase [Pilimelia sp.]|nr:bifunctional diguanylate cyclase/phosphodiesterase [Pilimelia sp.]